MARNMQTVCDTETLARFIAEGIADTLDIKVGATWTETLGAEFAVTLDNGQRFIVAVRPC